MSHSTAIAALIWWIIPLIGVTGAIGYVIWTSKYKDKFDNETNRSVSKFQLFQETLREPATPADAPAQGSVHPSAAPQNTPQS